MSAFYLIIAEQPLPKVCPALRQGPSSASQRLRLPYVRCLLLGLVRLASVLLVAVAGVLAAHGQAPPAGAIPNIIPPSPTAAALEKYGQVPVSTYTGVPNISVPLYEIKVRDLSIPLSLSYHAGGFRVSEEASWVGLGWSLQSGGAITRTVRGLDDLVWFVPNTGRPQTYVMPEPISPFGANTNNPANPGTGSANQNGNPLTGIMAYANSYYDVYTKDPADSTKIISQPYGNQGILGDDRIDWEPDDFRFTAGGYSGQFAFDQKGRVNILEQQKVEIESPIVTGQPYWKISAPDGFQYFFEASEVSGGASPDALHGNAITAWYLTRLVSPSGEEARLTYVKGANVAMQHMLVQTETKEHSDCSDEPPSNGYSVTLSQNGLVPQYLSRIDFKTGYVVFERDETATRADLQGAQRLKRIAVYSLADELQKEFLLQASYFEAPATSTGYTTPSASNNIDLRNEYEGKRLRLDAVIEKGSDGIAKPATIFSYSPTPLPVKSAYSVDFWGYYNGSNGSNNTTLIPRYAGPGVSGAYVTYPGANRTPDAAGMQACMLQKITYPTGGSTTFTFEPHEYGNIAEDDIQTSTVLATPPIRMRADNVDPSNGNIPSTRFTVTESTPVNILRYDLWVESANNKQFTYLSLIDDSTGQPFVSGTPGAADYFVATWYFPQQNVSNPNSSPSPYGTGYDNPYNNPNRITGNAQFLVPAGTYYFQARLPNCNDQDLGQCRAIVEVVQAYYSQLQTVKTIQANAIKLLAGGLRVTRTEDYDVLDPAHMQVRVYQYGPGTLMSVPVFKKIAPIPNYSFTCRSLQLSSNSFAAFSAGAKGASVGYSQVDVLQGPQGEGGKTSYYYYNLADRKIEYGDIQANIPTRSDDLNGYLQEQKTYRKTDIGFQLVSATNNSYESVNKRDLPAIFKGEKYKFSSATYTYGQRLYYYPIPLRWVRLVSTTKRQYDPQDATKFLATSTRYSYDTLNVGHMQVSQTRTRRSDGSTVLVASTYPADYTAVATGPLAQMRSGAYYQHSAEIETATKVYAANETAAQAQTVAGRYTEYDRPSAASKYLPVAQNTLDLIRPTALAWAVPALPPTGRYRRELGMRYEPATANVQQVSKTGDVPTTYLWGYANVLPVAQIKNATFEQVQATLSQLGFTATTLPTDAQALRDAFVQLRLRLPQAQIMGFTHRPLVGLTSQTDPSGRTVYYEYDALLRLRSTKDERGFLLQQQQYHYAGQ